MATVVGRLLGEQRVDHMLARVHEQPVLIVVPVLMTVTQCICLIFLLGVWLIIFDGYEWVMRNFGLEDESDADAPESRRNARRRALLRIMGKKLTVPKDLEAACDNPLQGVLEQLGSKPPSDAVDAYSVAHSSAVAPSLPTSDVVPDSLDAFACAGTTSAAACDGVVVVGKKLS